jgi:hypothetical protein
MGKVVIKATPGSSLAKARQDAHRAFDPIWQFGSMTRSEAYVWLAKQLSMPKHLCHVLYFNEEECKKVIEVSRKFKNVS